MVLKGFRNTEKDYYIIRSKTFDNKCIMYLMDIKIILNYLIILYYNHVHLH